MKKRYLTVITLLLTLSLLTACGTSKVPAPEATPTPTPAPAPTLTPKTEGMAMLLVRAGGTAVADLNGDGENESITYSTYGEYGESVTLTINGEDYSQTLLDAGFEPYYPSDRYFAVVDIDAGDGLLEIAIMDYGPSDDYTTHFVRYIDGELSYLGLLDGLIYSDYGLSHPVSLAGDGTGMRQIRYRVLQTWFGSTRWKYTEGEGFTELPPEGGVYDVYDGGLTALVDTAVYSMMDESSDRHVIPAGTKLSITGTDNDRWARAYIHTDEYDGYEAWLHLDAEYGQQIETANGYEFSGNVLSDLMFAD